MINRFLLAAGVALMPVAAFAQTAEASDKSSDQIVCELSGDCGASAEVALQEKPEQRGFSIARHAGSPAPVAAPVTRERMIPRAAAPAAGKMNTAATQLATAGRSNAAITFVAGSAQLTDGGKRQALQFLSALKAPQLAGKKFAVNGYTDASGNAKTNLDLSKKRAQAVVDFLVANGASASQLAAFGYGSERLLDPSNPASPANRRVEFVKIN